MSVNTAESKTRQRSELGSETESELRAKLAASEKTIAALQARNQDDAVRQSEERYRVLFQSIDEGFCVIEVLFNKRNEPIDYRFLEVNPAFEHHTGLKDAVGKTMREMAPYHEAHWFEIYGKVALTGESVRFENEAAQLGRYYGVNAFRVGRPEERKVAILFTDIIDRKRAEDALRKAKETAEHSRAELQAIFSSMAEGVVLFDKNGILLDMNAAALAVHGFDSIESMQMKMRDLTSVFELRTLDGKPLPFEEWPISRVMRGERFTGYEVRVLRNDGCKDWISSYGGAPVYDASGALSFAIITLRDVTERKREEEAVRKMRDELATSNLELERRVEERTAKLRDTIAELEHFSYTITHDMRAPLRAMQAFGEILREEYKNVLDKSGRDYLQRITESALRMDNLITDALNYSKVVQDELTLESIDPLPLLRSMVDSYPQFQPPRAIVNIAPSFPMVVGNQAGLTQCFSNLIGNAVKFVPEGQIPEVSVSAEERDGVVRLWFVDNGIGIEPEEQHRIFTMFQRVSKKYEGTGIGLALVRKVVQRMNGKVGLESEPGKGSRFWLDLAAAPRRS